ncbi:Lon protease [Podosphaera aphanis]|nr:Lon protease [Podosphaera aphanis]
MLYGQNLPWRLAFRNSKRYPKPLNISQSIHSSVNHYPAFTACWHRSNSISIFTTRHQSANFSTFPATRKESPKPAKSPTDDTLEESNSEKSDNSSSNEAAENKTKNVPAVSNLHSSVDEKGSSSGSGSDSKTATTSSAGSAGSAIGVGNSGNSESGKKSRKSSGDKALQKSAPPEIYPHVLAIPISKRPLFPGFYKPVTIRNKHVISAIQELLKRGQPYIGAFVFKDENSEGDTIENINDVYDTGVFAQITGAYTNNGEGGGITAIFYPHRRVKIQSLTNIDHGLTSADTKRTEITSHDISVLDKASTKQLKEQSDPIEKKDTGMSSFKQSNNLLKYAEKSSSFEPTAFLDKYPVSIAKIENLMEEPHDPKSSMIRALTNEIVNVFKDVASLNSLFRDQISTFSMSHSSGNVMTEPAKLADFAAAVSSGEAADLQDILETLNVEERLKKALVEIKKELMNAKLQSKITKDVEKAISDRQREYWLMEQMKGIRRELGIESDGKDKLVTNFKEKSEKLAMPESVKKVFDEELNKLAHLEPAASEFNVTRNYLDWLTQIPWGQRSVENFDIKNAITVLDEDHHGLKDVKDRILEFIAVGKLRGTVEGKIICFVGPPGVGKTSIGKSIARALNRQYYRFSVGGLADVAEIKGHRRTYVGALPGRIVQALKKCQTENPLILIDEIDKLGRGHQGDPASALLELLDPEQNNAFLDHYLDIPVDLSKVLFVCTANMTDTIPRPLLDRMEMIELSGYVADEKIAIAERYLGPAAKELSGLKNADVNLKRSAIEELIKSYCRESGVRNLKKHIEKVYRKSALKIVQDLPESSPSKEDTSIPEVIPTPEESKKDAAKIVETSEKIDDEVTQTPIVSLNVPSTVHVSIEKENLKDYVGPPIYTSDRLYDTTPPGVAMGLAWTQMGGAALYVESILESALSSKSRPALSTTGNLKSIMKESATIAYSFSKSVIANKYPENRFFDKAKLHLHCPEGAVPKDGPSAGITMATSLLSLALNKPLDPTIAMTGELTVTGKVLRIGGLREKTVAARRAGSKMIIFPDDNMSDWLELPENIKEGLSGHPVKWYSDVFKLVFPNLDNTEANNLWKEQLAKKDDNDD